MIDKEINLTLDSYDVVDESMEKIASNGNMENPSINALPEPYDPDFLYLRVRAISAGEYWGCFPEGQMVLMGDGSWKDIKDVKKGDYVYTPYGNIRKVLVKSEKDYKGYLEKLKFNKTKTEVISTPNHPMLSITRKDLSCPHDRYVRCMPQYAGNRHICNRPHTHCDFEVPFTEQWISSSSLNINDLVGYKFFVPEMQKNLSKEEMYFIGLYLAEGSLIYPEKRSKYISMAFDYKEKDTLVKFFLEEIAPNLKFNKIRGPYSYEDRGSCVIYIYDDKWFSFLEKNFGRYSYGKYIPSSINFSNNSEYLLQGFIDGDGTVDEHERVTFNTTSKELGRCLFDLCVSLGYLPSITIREFDKSKGHRSVLTQYQISMSTRNRQICGLGIKKTAGTLKQDKSHAFIHNDKYYTKLTDKERIFFEGKVYNLEVEEDHSYIVNGMCTKNCNKNADFFSEKELRECYHTFLDAHVFSNHQNKQVEKAIGAVLDAQWNNDMKYVELLIKIDKQLAPTIVRGFLKGYTTDVSMGCRVSATICSICGNRAKTRADFCEHVKRQRNQILPDGRRVFEYNLSPRFHDISVVLNGADRTAKALEIIKSDPTTPEKTPVKIAKKEEHFKRDLEKCASTDLIDEEPITHIKLASNINKLADFQKEIVDKLYILSIIHRLEKSNLSDEELETLINDAREAALPLHLGLGKTASTVKDLRNIVLGGTGLALATNYYQGKRLRGEELNKVQHFMADNPGVLPLAYMIGGYPAYKKLKRKLPNLKSKLKNTNDTNDTKALVKKSLENYQELLSKEANDLSDISVNGAINVFTNDEVAELFKKSYHVSDEKLKMIKLALPLHQAGREDLVDKIKEAYSITDKDIGNFLKLSFDIIDDHLDKEANLARGILEANIINNSGRIPTGMSAVPIAGSLVDGFLIHKFFYDKDGKKKNSVEAVKGVKNTVVRNETE